ncbi:NAD(P)-binding protein [Aspergillus avenaceus]|uniref:NAD(P)-binding protein n=1 Tax=Aspergillus avenaceus TaxID=36643 RepID=A0A5N6TZ35_ASPAV|nr:NAD(P)-binding protein [Aspergillus avenaceus]
MSQSLRLLDKVAIVTGSSSGMGRAISTRYAREGAKLVCADISVTSRSDSPEEKGINTHDLIKKDGGDSIFVHTDATFGRVDVMVNNVGICLEAHTMPVPCHLTEESVWDKTMPAQMLRQDPHSSGDRGWIVNMSSTVGLVGAPGVSSYSASKGAVSNLTRQVALDYARDRIHVNALCPGFTHTSITKEMLENWKGKEHFLSMIPSGRLGEPDDVAKMAVVLASDDIVGITGVCVPVDGGVTAA